MVWVGVGVGVGWVVLPVAPVELVAEVPSVVPVVAVLSVVPVPSTADGVPAPFSTGVAAALMAVTAAYGTSLPLIFRIGPAASNLTYSTMPSPDSPGLVASPKLTTRPTRPTALDMRCSATSDA